MKSLKDLLTNININADTNPDRVVSSADILVAPFQRSKEMRIEDDR